jgi:magnesium transporter
MIKTYFYNSEEKKMYHDIDLREKSNYLNNKHHLLWIDLYNCSFEELKYVGEIFDFHPLALEDCLHDSPRSKVDNYDDYYFFTFHALRYDEESEKEITTEELNVFLGKNYIVTVHKNPLQSIGKIAYRSLRAPHFMDKGPDFLLYSIVDGITDEYFPIMERINARIDELEDEMYVHPAQEITEEFLALKRTIVLIRRVIQPKKRIFAGVGGRYSFNVHEDNVPYYMDLVDHLERISDSLEVARDLVSGAMETYYSLVSARTNDTMRILTIITTVTATLTAITGYFGMNTPLPFQKSWITTIIITFLLVIISLYMVYFFKKKKWL